MQFSNRHQAVRDILSANLRIGASRDVRLAGWLLLALACGFLAYVARVNEITHDVFHEMALYREALASENFPKEDVFAFTPTVNPSVHHEWGTGAILYLATVESGLGLVGLASLRLLLMCALWLFLYRIARMRGAHPYVFACVAVATFPVFWVGFAMIRAQLFTMVFLAAQMWMQELDWRGRRTWVIAWWLMLVAWLNIHAGFVVGLGLYGFHCLERFGCEWFNSKSFNTAIQKTWHLIAGGLSVAIALPINPYGWEYIPYLMHAITMPRPLIQEWHALWHTFAPEITVPTFALSVFLLAYCQRHIRVGRMRGAAYLALCAYETLKHIRHGSLYGTVWLAYVPAWLTHTPLGKSIVRIIDGHRTLTIRTCQFISMGCLVFSCINQFWRPTLPATPLHSVASYPTSAVEYLKQHGFTGNLLTPFNQGAYLSWEMYPAVRVSLDGRYEVAYQDQVMDDHHRLYSGQVNWIELLEKYPCDAALVDQNADLRPKLEIFRDQSTKTEFTTKSPWRFVYEDDAFVILAPTNCPLPYVDRRDQPLIDGAWSTFSAAQSYRAKRFHDARRSVSPRLTPHQRLGAQEHLKARPTNT